MTINVQRETFVAHSQLLAVLLEAPVILGLISGAFPLALANPVLYLRLADAAVGLAPVLLVSSDPDLGLESSIRGVGAAAACGLRLAVGE